MTKEELVKILNRILKTEADLEYLLKLEVDELESLVAIIRDRVEGGNACRCSPDQE